MLRGHPLDPFASWSGVPMWVGASGLGVFGSGYGVSFGFARTMGLGSKGGRGDFTGLDDGLLLAHTSKGGEAQGRLVGAPWVIARGLKDSPAYGTIRAHPYLLGFGEKSITAAIGWALTYGHARALAHGLKSVSGFATGREHSRSLARGEKAGNGRALTIEAAELLARGEHVGAGFGLDGAHAFVLGRGQKTGLGYGLERGAPWLVAFGVKVGGGTAADGFGFVFSHGRLAALSSKLGTGFGLTDAEARALAQGSKAGAFGTDIGGLALFGSPYLRLEGAHGGQGFLFDPVFTLAHGAKLGTGYGFAFGATYLLANGSRVITLYPIRSKTGPALLESMFGPAIVE